MLWTSWSGGQAVDRASRPATRAYRISLHHNLLGPDQSRHLSLRNVTEALAYILNDECLREADVWEDGQLVCQVWRNPFEVAMCEDDASAARGMAASSETAMEPSP